MVLHSVPTIRQHNLKVLHASCGDDAFESRFVFAETAIRVGLVWGLAHGISPQQRHQCFDHGWIGIDLAALPVVANDVVRRVFRQTAELLFMQAQLPIAFGPLQLGGCTGGDDLQQLHDRGFLPEGCTIHDGDPSNGLSGGVVQGETGEAVNPNISQ